MAYLTETELKAMGFKALGKDVKVSDRAAIYNADQISIGDRSRIDDFCIVSGKVTIGKNVHLAIYSHVAGGEPGVTMDDFSGLAYGAQVFAQTDDYSGGSMTNPTVPDAYKHVTKKPVHLGRHVILGTNTIVLPGVTIADGCATGAMAMVTKSTEPWSIYIGSPARRVKARSQDLLVMEAQYLASLNQD